MFRLTRALAMVPVAVAVLLVLLVSEGMLSENMNGQAEQASISGTLHLMSTPGGTIVNGSYSNFGNRTAALPPIAVPLALADGVPFAVGPPSIGGPLTSSAGGTSVVLDGPSDEAACNPELKLSETNVQGFAWVAGAQPMGPATLTAVFGGPSAWPSSGYGLMVSANLSSLFVIRASGTVNPTVVVAYDNYSQSLGQITGQYASSSPFLLGTGTPTVFTVTLTGLGSYTVSVDGTPRLNGPLQSFLPGPSPLGVWATNNSSVVALITSFSGNTLWMGAPDICGYFSLVPLAANSRPTIALNSSPAAIVGPITVPNGVGTSIYVLEVMKLGSGSPATVSLTGCRPVLLGVDENLAFTLPWAN